MWGGLNPAGPIICRSNNKQLITGEIMLKIILAPDSFKGSLTSVEVIDTLHASIRRNWGEHEVVRVPVADGGEGTAEALVTAARGTYRNAQVSDWLGRPRRVRYGVIHGDTAVLEYAAVAGLGQVPKDQHNPLKATSYGMGELIRRVLDDGYKKILIGIGGSITNDGGMGLLSALGVRFYWGRTVLYGRGADLERVDRIDLSGLDARIRPADIRVICDVTNTLLGEQGATYIYGPQKGAVGAIRDRLEAGMAHYAQVFKEQSGLDIADLPGAGAAGGVGAALGCVLGAALCRGIDTVLDAVRFDVLLKGVGLVVTGEGRLDGQSVRFGKVPAGIARRCAREGIPVAIVVGSLGEGWEDIYNVADCSVMTAVNAPMTAEEAIRNAQELLRCAADRMFRFLGLLPGSPLSKGKNPAAGG